MTQYCCKTRERAIRDGEMDKNYAKMGWAWPVVKAVGVVPRYVWTFCPFCGADLPPILDDDALKRIMAELYPPPPPPWPMKHRFPDWLLKHRPDWQADGEGGE